jgi:hypothetical protein
MYCRRGTIAARGLPQVTATRKRSLEALRYWCSDAVKDGGEKIPVVEGRAAARLNDENDIVALRVSSDQDRLTKLVRQRFGVLFAVGIVEGESASTVVANYYV